MLKYCDLAAGVKWYVAAEEQCGVLRCWLHSECESSSENVVPAIRRCRCALGVLRPDDVARSQERPHVLLSRSFDREPEL